MRTVVDYQILTGLKNQVVRQVMEYSANGYEPLGAAQPMACGHDWFAATVIKYGKTK